MNKLMTRIYSAMNAGEDLLLDQLQDDLHTAKVDGSIDTPEYKITAMGDDTLVIKDKINNELTRAIPQEDGIKLQEVIKTQDPTPTQTLTLNGPVTWVDGTGASNTGKLLEINGDISTVLVNDRKVTVQTKLLNKMGESQVEFSKSRARKFLVDKNNNIMATGWESSLGKLKKDHPDWKQVDSYDVSAYNSKIQKRFSSFSEENQKIFTKPYRRFAILDTNGKLKYITDVSNVGGLLKKNPGFTSMKEVEYRKSLQKSLKNFSDANREMIINNIYSKVEEIN